MRQQLYKNVLLLVICTLSIGLQAQDKKTKQATEEFEEYAFADARKLYKRLAERGFTSPEVLKKLGDSYYLTAEYQEAVTWYGQLIDSSKENDKKTIEPEYYLSLIHI